MPKGEPFETPEDLRSWRCVLARKQLDPAAKLSAALNVKLTPEVHAVWLAKVEASGLSGSEYFRRSILESRTVIVPVERTDTTTLRLLGVFTAVAKDLEQVADQAREDWQRGILSEQGYQDLLLRQFELLEAFRTEVLHVG